MPTEISTGKRTIGQFTVEYQQNGYGGCIPIIDGKPEPRLTFGYVTESDKRACIKAIEEALRATNGSITDTIYYLMNAVQVAANEIKPDEAVEVESTDGLIEILISYADRKAYLNTEIIADISDITTEMPNEAVKALLTSRAQLELNKRLEESKRWEEEDDDPYSYEDGENW